MNKKYISIFLIIMVVFSGLVYAGNNNDFDAKKLGEYIRQAFEEKPQKMNDVLCYVNGVEILKKDFEIFKESTLSYNPDTNEEELFKRYIKFVLVLNEAEKEGFTVSEQEAEEYTNVVFDSLENDEEIMRILKEYIDGMGITMDEYKEMTKEFNYKTLLTMKLQDKLRTEFLEQNKGARDNSTEINNTFNNYLNNYKEELFDDAEIIMNDN